MHPRTEADGFGRVIEPDVRAVPSTVEPANRQIDKGRRQICRQPGGPCRRQSLRLAKNGFGEEGVFNRNFPDTDSDTRREPRERKRRCTGSR